MHIVRVRCHGRVVPVGIEGDHLRGARKVGRDRPQLRHDLIVQTHGIRRATCSDGRVSTSFDGRLVRSVPFRLIEAMQAHETAISVQQILHDGEVGTKLRRHLLPVHGTLEDFIEEVVARTLQTHDEQKRRSCRGVLLGVGVNRRTPGRCP